MVLEVKQMNKIVGEILNDQPPSIKTKEALRFRKKVKEEIDNLPEGMIVDLPFDPEFTDEDLAEYEEDQGTSKKTTPKKKKSTNDRTKKKKAE